MSSLFSRAPFLLFVLVPACRAAAPSAPSPAPHSTAPGLEERHLGSIARLHVLGDVYLASQPQAADFAAAKELGIRTVINLRTSGEQADFDERAAVEGLGLGYVNLPIAGAGDLSDANLDRARELLKSAPRPLLVHCASANRVGAVWLPYRVLDGGLELDAALIEAKTVGLKSPELEAKAREYVSHHAEPR